MPWDANFSGLELEPSFKNSGTPNTDGLMALKIFAVRIWLINREEDSHNQRIDFSSETAFLRAANRRIDQLMIMLDKMLCIGVTKMPQTV